MKWRYFNVDGSMEKKWDTVIPADLKRLFVSGTYIFNIHGSVHHSMTQEK
jgi:hypothetical protein